MGIGMVLGNRLEAASPSFADFDRRATTGEALSVVFFGGSLTWGANASDPQRTSYRGLMISYLQDRYPKASFRFYDAAIGGTGSKLGMFRLQRDVLARKPDLVFLDFTANDNLTGTDPQSLDSYETIVRELIGNGVVVQQATFAFKSNFGKGWNPGGLKRVADHHKLAKAYNLGTGDVLPHLQSRLEKGEFDLNQLWPFDGAHPDDVGYRVFFDAVRTGFEQAIAEKRVCAVPDQPVFTNQYRHRTRHRLAERPLPSGWKVAKTYRTSLWFDGLSSRWMDDVVMCDGNSADAIEPLKIEFEGTFVALFGEADEKGLSFKATVDGKPLKSGGKNPTDVFTANTSRFGAGRLFIWRQLADDLPPGKHTLEITPVIPAGENPKGQLRIESICVAGQ